MDYSKLPTNQPYLLHSDCVRGFCKFVLDPIFKVFDSCMNKTHEEALALAEKMKIKLTVDEKDLQVRT